jgi:hypothetical protein
MFNREHTPTQLKPDILTEMELAPRISKTLVVFQQDATIRLCMLGSESVQFWSGDICDSENVAKQCKYFQPKLTDKQAADEFCAKMADDDFVYANYQDIAALQWVIEDRIYKTPLSWWGRLLLWFHILVRRAYRPKMLPPASDEPIPGDLWQNADAEDTGK